VATEWQDGLSDKGSDKKYPKSGGVMDRTLRGKKKHNGLAEWQAHVGRLALELSHGSRLVCPHIKKKQGK